MKELYILRHAESEKSEAATADHERALTPVGVADAREVGRCLARIGALPEVVIASSARRALETARLVLAELNGAPEVEENRALYLADPQQWKQRLQRVPDTASRVMIVGHNPGLHDLALRMTRGAAGALAAGLPPAGLVVLRLPVGRWADIDQAKGELLHFLTPDFPAPR